MPISQRGQKKMCRALLYIYICTPHKISKQNRITICQLFDKPLSK